MNTCPAGIVPFLASILSMSDRARGSLSLKIVGLCVGAYIAVAALDGSGLVRQEQILSALGCSYDGVVRQQRIYQLVTAALLHSGLTHLLFNMLTLWMLGPPVERQLGRLRYLFFSLLCAGSGFAGFLLLDRGNSVVVGYSGVLFGIMVAQALFFPNNRIYMFGFFPLKMKHAVILLGAIELYLTASPEGSRVANSAHLFGGLAAFVYLAPGRMNWRWQLGVTSAPEPDTNRPVPAPREWGEAGAMIAEAMRDVDSGDFGAARRCLKRSRTPWPLRSAVRGVTRLVPLAERFRATASDDARDAVERQVVAIWLQLLEKELFLALPPLANVGLLCGGGRLVPLLVDSLSNVGISTMPVATRQRLEAGLAETGAAGIEAVIIRVSDVATAPDAANRLLVTLSGLKLQQHAPVIMKYHGQAGADDRFRLVARVASMKENAAGALCDLLAGACNRMPPDLSLARDLQAQVGVRELEQIALRWAAGGHRGAQAVLRRLYEQSA